MVDRDHAHSNPVDLDGHRGDLDVHQRPVLASPPPATAHGLILRLFRKPGGLRACGLVGDEVVELRRETVLPCLLGLRPAFHVALDGLGLGGQGRLQHLARLEHHGYRRRLRGRHAAERGDLVGEDLGVHQFVGNLRLEELPEVLTEGTLHHRGVQPVHDDRLELAAQVLVQSLDQLLGGLGRHGSSGWGRKP